MFVTVAHGSEPVLVEELASLDIVATAGRGGVRIAVDLESAYRICLYSRVAGRVLLPLGEVPAGDAEQLYEGALAVEWETVLAPEATFAVYVEGSNDELRHSQFTALRIKDAIVDRLQSEGRARPVVDAESPDLSIFARVDQSRAFLMIDLSSGGLHRRGYRGATGAAPIRENVAAALLWRARWPAACERGEHFVDPMCGSGTILIEAAAMALRAAPGIGRPCPSPGYLQSDRELWGRLQAQAVAERQRAYAGKILGFDRDPHAVALALEHVKAAGFDGMVEVRVAELAELGPQGTGGLLATNPPYGERLGGGEDLHALYALLGERLRAHYLGWSAAVMVAQPSHGLAMGLRARRRFPLKNGAIDTQLLCFDHLTERDVESKRQEEREQRRAAALETPQAIAFRNRLQKRAKHLTGWAKREDTDAYRVYDCDLPDYAVSVDRYGDHLVIQEYEAPAEIPADEARARLGQAVALSADVLGVERERIVVKRRIRRRAGEQHEKYDATGEEIEVHEGDARILVNLRDYVDTGLFLDHRGVRRELRKLAKGVEALNLFAYTATATVHMGLGGATRTTSVDLSNTYTAWAERNLGLNRLVSAKHRVVRADCLDWLEDAVARRLRFGLIFVDPPTFSTSKAMASTFDVQRDHNGLLSRCVTLLAPGGDLVFSTNLRSFKLDPRWRDGSQGVALEDWTARTLPEDFSRDPKIHQVFRLKRVPGPTG